MGTPAYCFSPTLRKVIWRAQLLGTEIMALIGTLIVEEFLDSGVAYARIDADRMFTFAMTPGS